MEQKEKKKKVKNNKKAVVIGGNETDSICTSVYDSESEPYYSEDMSDSNNKNKSFVSKQTFIIGLKRSMTSIMKNNDVKKIIQK